MGRPSGLGRGLGALIPPKPSPKQAPSASQNPETESNASVAASFSAPASLVIEIPVHQIERNPHQPRRHFDHAQLEDLIASIKEHGVIQPLVVTEKPEGGYQLIAGERRLRAATIAGLERVPVVVRTANDQDKLELAIIENVQRQDLNAIEEARAYVRLMEEFGLTQDDVSRKVGKSRPQVANTVRLLQLPEEIQQALMDGRLSASHARTLLSLQTDAERMSMFQAMLAGNFTVRQTETHVYQTRRTQAIDPNLAAAEDRLRERLHCRVRIKKSPKGDGEFRLAFTSEEEYDDLLDRLTGT